MKKWIFRIIFLLLFGVFVFSGVSLFLIYRQYSVGRKAYNDAVVQYTRPAAPEAEEPFSDLTSLPPEQQSEGLQNMMTSSDTAIASSTPFEIDFDALKKINEDIVGWIYCEGTPINYPLLQTDNNDYYLHKSYDRSYLFNGSIFVEARNQPVFLDYNTIIYGHNMRDGSMFEVLESWQSQSFYDAHPYMWIFTPEQDYILAFFSGYTTSSTSDAYDTFSEPGDDLTAYLENALAQSDFHSEIELDPNARYVMLSTCSYVFDNSRYVLHGRLFQTRTAGGKLIAGEE